MAAAAAEINNYGVQKSQQQFQPSSARLGSRAPAESAGVQAFGFLQSNSGAGFDNSCDTNNTPVPWAAQPMWAPWNTAAPIVPAAQVVH